MKKKKEDGSKVQKSIVRANHRVSQNDIAREAGVSRVTVSLVLSGKDQTSQETRKRVLEAAERLKYRPNLLVQGMQTGRTFAIGIIMPASMQFQARIAHGIHDELVTANYVPIMLWTSEIPEGRATELEQIHRLVDRRVDGVIIWPADVSVPDQHFHEIWDRQIPLVTVDRETETNADHVGTDEELGGRLAAEHLLSLGHKSFLCISREQLPGAPLARRTDAFVHRIQEAGLPCKVVLTTPSDLQAQDENIREELRQILRVSNRPTGIFGATDPIAMTVYRLANELGLKIPDDLSVVGYADFAFAPDMTPALTTIRQDPYQMGRTAGQIMMDRVSGKAAKKTRKMYIKPEIIVRNSTAKPGLR